MKKWLTILLAAVLLFGAQAYADNFYLIEDSDTRYLTEEELWGWNYDALGYILNEIFARHGYHFSEGGKYDRYFENQDWYRENTTYLTNEEIHRHLVTSVEWYNERLVKDVREAMRAMDTVNPDGLSVEDARRAAQSGAELVFFPIGRTDKRTVPVYSCPTRLCVRGANGKASVTVGTGDVYTTGKIGDWIMVLYWTNQGISRVGYISEDDLGCEVTEPALALSSRSAYVSRSCAMTDDMMTQRNQLAALPANTQVTYLGFYGGLAYIETTVSGVPARGFVPREYIVFFN